MPAPPYLSVIAAARNDDHGGDFMRRLHFFVNALADQAKRFALPVELILVEWNPPFGRLPLKDALRSPADREPMKIRILTVPPEIHSRYVHASALPLYQMIAKNVGIRRATGEFILATNADILFSDELMKYFAERRLEKGRMYRIDRHDVAAGIPADVPVKEQLEYCRTHRIRVNTREGTFPLSPEGLRAIAPLDIAPPEAGIVFGKGWYAPEQYFGRVFRWLSNEAEITLPKMGARRTLLLELEPGPGAFSDSLALRFFDGGEKEFAAAKVVRRCRIRVRVPESGGLLLRANGGARRTPGDPRTLTFRVFRCGLDSRELSQALQVGWASPRLASRCWQIGAGVLHLLARRRGPDPLRFGLPFSDAVLRYLRFRRGGGGIQIGFGGGARAYADPAAPADLHTNACGDFTLMHRSHWLELRGYPEFDLYSMNLDSVFCYMAHCGGATEQVLAEPMRIYHIEHAVGSGWTPEGHDLLFARLAEKGIPWLDFEDVLNWAAQMERLQTTFVFNRDNWGLADVCIKESIP